MGGRDNGRDKTRDNDNDCVIDVSRDPRTITGHKL